MCCCLSCGDICLFAIAIILPPFPVLIRRGLCSADFIINILLCMLGFIPGLLHSWYIISKYPPVYAVYDEERLLLPAHGGPNCHVVYVEVPPSRGAASPGFIEPVASNHVVTTPPTEITEPISTYVTSETVHVKEQTTPTEPPPEYSEIDDSQHAKTQHEGV